MELANMGKEYLVIQGRQIVPICLGLPWGIQWSKGGKGYPVVKFEFMEC